MDSKLVPWIVIGVLGVFLSGTCYRLNGVQRARNVAVANHQAALDTTRRYLVRETESLSRLVHQEEIETDGLADILNTTKDSITALLLALKDRDIEHLVAVQALHFEFDSVTRENASRNADLVTTSRTGDEFRIVAIDIDSAAITGDIDISVPLDTAKNWEIEYLRLRVKPFDAVYTLGCAGNNAVVAAQAPEWVSMDLKPGRVDDEVCNPPQRISPLGSIFSFSPGNVIWGVVGVVGGFLLGR